VIAVPDGLEALARTKQSQAIDVLVTDVVMPNLGGIELAEVMMVRHPRMGVVLLSGYTAETLDLERIIAQGATFVSKPVTSNSLVQAVLNAIAARRAAADGHSPPLESSQPASAPALEPLPD
jgi:two-component system, cell cycle sensor histidine kinase and response regulator CckA